MSFFFNEVPWFRLACFRRDLHYAVFCSTRMGAMPKVHSGCIDSCSSADAGPNHVILRLLHS